MAMSTTLTNEKTLPFLKSITEYSSWQKNLSSQDEKNAPCLKVCNGTGCRALGSQKVVAALHQELQGLSLEKTIEIVDTGCPGFCECGPLITIYPERISYQKVKVSDVTDIIQETLVQGKVIQRLLYTNPQTSEHIQHEQDLPFYQKQRRQVLNVNGSIDPKKISDYVANGGYSALVKVLGGMDPELVIAEVKSSGLRGRGGAGFSTGLKWELCRKNVLTYRKGYVICNADEGDPGAFMDRSVMEGNPHSVIEGMLIGAFAMGIHEGYVYIRAEYPLAVENLKIAIQAARETGLLESNILGSGFDFDLKIRLGAGAFVCGEETALMASIEGRIGEPRPRPPFPAERGLWDKPSNINNVETWANIPLIINNGSAEFAATGTAKSKGTKIFSLVGKINNTGLVEVPMGITLREIIFDIGGGIPKGKKFKAAQLGGPSGGCIPAEHLDVEIDYESLVSLGAIMGSGGMVVADEDTCMVDFARYFMTFTQEESCGKCVACRVGTRAMLATLERICAGNGQLGDIDYLVEIGEEVKRSSLCGLGQTAPNPVLSTIRYFRDEYEAHIIEKKCPAKVCKGLITYRVIPGMCHACLACLKVCPVGAMVGSRREDHVIDQSRCIRCGMCMSICRFGAIEVN